MIDVGWIKIVLKVAIKVGTKKVGTKEDSRFP
jgi:hypothetical protein